MRERWRNSRRAAGAPERGATLVEFALIVPLLLLFIFGIIDFGITYNNQQSIRSAVREGTRRAIVGPAKVAEGACTSGDVRCIVKRRASANGLKTSDTFVKVCFPTASSGAACPTTDPGAKNIGDTIRVCAIYPVESLTGLLNPFLSNLRLTTRVDLRLEQPWTAGTTATQTDSGQRGTWDFCDA